jgi:hypothetical protein
MSVENLTRAHKEVKPSERPKARRTTRGLTVAQRRGCTFRLAIAASIAAAAQARRGQQ